MPDKTLPSSVETEMAVLGCCLMDATCLDYATELLQPETFYNLHHKTIFKQICALYQDNKTVDMITLIDKLKTENELNSIGGAVYVTNLIDTVSTTKHLEEWVSIIKGKAMARSLLAMSEQLEREIYAGEPVEKVLETTEAALFELSHAHTVKKILTTSELMKKACDYLEERQKGKVQGYTTGLLTIDKYAKFQDGNFWILGGRPSTGKTSLASRMSYAASVAMGKPLVFFSLETSDIQLAVRFICQAAHIDKYRVSKEDWQTIIRIADDINKTGLIIDDTPRMNPMILRSKLRRYIRQQNVGMVVIDYLQLLDGTHKRRESRQTEMMDVSKDLKALCKEFNIPFLVLSQLNREVEDRLNKRPKLSDLRESGAIEQDSDVCILLTRDEYYWPDRSKGLAQIQVAKHRAT